MPRRNIPVVITPKRYAGKEEAAGAHRPKRHHAVIDSTIKENIDGED
jgi:hypothetical protein